MRFRQQSELAKPKAVKTATVSRALVLAALLSGCANNPNHLTTSATRTAIEEQTSAEASLSGARFSFHYSDYFTLTYPDPRTKCAGDLRNFYDLYCVAGQTGCTGSSTSTGMASWVKLGDDSADTDRTQKPAFIKNVSVDLTDS